MRGICVGGITESKGTWLYDIERHNLRERTLSEDWSIIVSSRIDMLMRCDREEGSSHCCPELRKTESCRTIRSKIEVPPAASRLPAFS